MPSPTMPAPIAASPSASGRRGWTAVSAIYAAYARNLNVIERLWKVMHQHVTHNRYHADFRTFAEAITRFFKTDLPIELENNPRHLPPKLLHKSAPRNFGSLGNAGITN